jgi:hypothetical protein
MTTFSVTFIPYYPHKFTLKEIFRYGVCIIYYYFDTEVLRDRVVINPQWIVDVMAKVVSVNEKSIKVRLWYTELL